MSQPKLLFKNSVKQISILAVIAILGTIIILSVFFLVSDSASNSYATSVNSEITAEVDGTHYVTLSAPDVTFSINPTDSAQLSKQSINVSVETNAPGGADLYLSMANSTNALHLNGDTTSTAPAIEATASSVAANSLAANTWGYSTDDQTYSAVPANDSNPALLAAVDGSSVGSNAGGIITASVPVYYAANVDTSIPAGSYSNRLAYSAVVDGGIITEATLTKIEIDGAEVDTMQPEVENTLEVTTNLMTNTYGTPRVYLETTDPAGYQECGGVVVSRNESGYMTITCKATPTQAATGVTLHIVPKGSSDDHFCTDGTYTPDTSDCEAGEWKWGSLVMNTGDIVKPVNGLLDIVNMQDMTPEVCAKSAEGDTKRLVDTRDGKMYWVAKLADGNCWMTQNLDLDLTAGQELTPDTSDVNEPWDPGITTFTSVFEGVEDNFVIAQSWNLGNYIVSEPGNIETSGCNSNSGYSGCTSSFTSVEGKTAWNVDINAGRPATELISFDGTNYDARFLVGNHYSFQAATAGTTPTSGAAPASICPAGWRLPHGDSPDEWIDLLRLYGFDRGSSHGGAIYATPLYFVRSGYVAPGARLMFAGRNGSYWGNDASSNGTMAGSLAFYEDTISYGTGVNSDFAHAVRCVAR